MQIRKSVPFYYNNYLPAYGNPILNRDRRRHNQRDRIKGVRSPGPPQKIINAEKSISIRHTTKRGREYRIPVAKRKRSSPVPQEMNGNGQWMDSELNELDWLDEQW